MIRSFSHFGFARKAPEHFCFSIGILACSCKRRQTIHLCLHQSKGHAFDMQTRFRCQSQMVAGPAFRSKPSVPQWADAILSTQGNPASLAKTLLLCLVGRIPPLFTLKAPGGVNLPTSSAVQSDLRHGRWKMDSRLLVTFSRLPFEWKEPLVKVVERNAVKENHCRYIVWGKNE